MSPNSSGATTDHYTEPVEPFHVGDNATKPDSTSDLPMIKNKEDSQMEIVWTNVTGMVVIHAFFLYGTYLLLSFRVMAQTILFISVYILCIAFGITAGAHRLWAHRTYKANLPLRIFLMLANSAANQNSIYVWARDHRVHHKFTDTDADPHNATRGFFFSHVGWLLCKKHKDVLTKGKTVDMSDVLSDPVVRFQMKYYIPLTLIFNYFIPTIVPWYYFGENGWTAFVISIWKYAFSLNSTWLVNSAAHKWGSKPYDIRINPSENKMVAWFAYGEGWHNYHHVFPWDYKAAELGNYRLNFTTAFLDFMAKIGWATELRTASEEMIRKRLLRTGDFSQLPYNVNNDGYRQKQNK